MHSVKRRKMSALQQHKEAVAKLDLKKKFLSGAACAAFLLLEDSEMDEWLTYASGPTANVDAAATVVPGASDAALAGVDTATANYTVPRTECEGTAANGAEGNAQIFKRRCMEENAIGARGSSRDMSTMSARCADDLLLDRQRCAVKKRPVDDIRLDRKRMRRTDADAGSYAGSQTALISQNLVILQRSSEMSVNCIVMLEAQDAPT